VSGLMLSNFGKMFVLPAILWGHQYSILYTWLCNIFTMAANVQAIRGKKYYYMLTLITQTLNLWRPTLAVHIVFLFIKVVLFMSGTIELGFAVYTCTFISNCW